MGLAAAIAGGGALLSTGASLYGASQAANAQEKAAQTATNAQLQMFNTTQKNLQPFINTGNNFASLLSGNIGSLTTPFQPTEAQLASTPGYQFTLSQGLQAVNNANSAEGWGLSGPGLKGIAQYATGLADTTYNQQFQNYLAQNSQIYNMLLGGTQLGANAAAGLGGIAAQTGGQIGSNIIGAGNAAAAANIAGANAIGSNLSGLPLNFLLMNQLVGNNSILPGIGGGYSYTGLNNTQTDPTTGLITGIPNIQSSGWF